MQVQEVLFFLPGFLIGLTVHESAHAVTAKWLGDDTAERLGRVSLNPLRHLSPMGTIAIFILGFGWGKPVPVNIRRFTRPRFHYFLTSMAGPVSNLIISAAALGLLYLRPGGIVSTLLVGAFLINALMAVFNLLPVPPLDGSKIWPVIIPGAERYFAGQWSVLWLVVLLVGFYTGTIGRLLGPVFELLLGLLPG